MSDDKREDLAPGILTVFEGMRKTFRDEHPLFGGLQPRPVSANRGRLVIELTPGENFLHDGEIHPGLMTIILDTILGASVWSMLDSFTPIATINLQTDTQNHANPGKVITCEALCEDICDDVAITRGRATSEDGTLLSTAAGTFIVGTRSAQVSRI
ncbi:MAG: PaaI family thioesterase [Pseudomonadota bacterium]